MKPRAPAFQLVILCVSLAAYFALALWMTAHWKPLGDEPHYLLAAHSLAVDRDVDLANNYAQRDFQNFLEGETLDPHVKILPNGAQILNHDLGLPFLLALPYALGGRAGAELFLALCGALLAWQMWKLAYDVTRDARASTLAWFALAFTPPLVLYGALIYPEVIGALIFIWVTRRILFHTSAQNSAAVILVCACGAALLPWLSIRFSVLAALLVGFVALEWRGNWKRALPFFFVVAFSVAAYFFVNTVLLAGSVPKGTPSDIASGNLVSHSFASLARGVLGWWIDPQRGTLIMAPVYILALAGIPRLLRGESWRVGILLLSPLLVLIPLVTLLGGFWIPFEVGARYFVVALPLLVAPLAWAFHAALKNSLPRWQRAAFGVIAGVTLVLSLYNAALMLADASYAYGSVVSAYSRALGTDVSAWFAGMGHAAYISPQNAPPQNSTVRVVQRDGEWVWRAQSGSAATIVSSFDLTELTVGNYAITFRAAARGNSSDAELVTLDVFSAEGLPLVHSSWSAQELASDSLQPIAIYFDNPYFDRWGFPLTLQVTTTGDAELDLSALTFDPNTPTTWLRAALWVALIGALIFVLDRDLFRAQAKTKNEKFSAT